MAASKLVSFRRYKCQPAENNYRQAQQRQLAKNVSNQVKFAVSSHSKRINQHIRSSFHEPTTTFIGGLIRKFYGSKHSFSASKKRLICDTSSKVQDKKSSTQPQKKLRYKFPAAPNSADIARNTLKQLGKARATQRLSNLI